MATSISSNLRSAASQVALAQTGGRVGFAVQNQSDATVYISYADLSSSSNFSVAIPSSAYFEGPNSYQGPISVAWAFGGTGYILVTEIGS